jgi:hypothetical protein
MKKEKMKDIIKGFESEHELLMLAFDGLEESYHDLLRAVVAVRLTLEFEGDSPRRHRRIMSRHRRQWPYLWRRIDELMELIDEQGRRAKDD